MIKIIVNTDKYPNILKCSTYYNTLMTYVLFVYISCKLSLLDFSKGSARSDKRSSCSLEITDDG